MDSKEELNEPTSLTAASGKVPVTVGILTYTSSIECVGETLASALDFAEIIICDGGSTDGTRQLAERYGCRIIDQSAEFIDEKGRLVNEAGVNEQILVAASNDWVFFLDHDELATPELVSEIRDVVMQPRQFGAYSIPRLYTLDGTIINQASVYPRFQVRLVHRAAVVGYQGVVHSPVVMRDGEGVGQLENFMLVPQPPQRELWSKWRGYLRLEEANKSTLTRKEWARDVLRPQLRMAKWIAYRTVKVRRTGQGTRLPLRYEVSRMLYELAVIVYTGRRFVGLGRVDAKRAWQ